MNSQRTPSGDNGRAVVAQPDLLIQFIGTIADCDPAEKTITFRMREIPPAQAEAFASFAEEHISAETQILLLVYDLSDFEDYHKQIVVQLQAQQRTDQ